MAVMKNSNQESTVGKKMAAVQRIRHQESQIFTIFVPVLSTLCIVGLKILQPFCAFL